MSEIIAEGHRVFAVALDPVGTLTGVIILILGIYIIGYLYIRHKKGPAKK